MRKLVPLSSTVFAAALLLGACNSSTDGNTSTTGGTNATEDAGTATDSGTGTDSSTTGTGTGTNSSTTGGTDTNTGTETSGDQTGMKSKMEELDYAEFEIEVDYGNDKEYEAKIETDDGMLESKLEDELNNRKVRGQEAFDEIYPKLKNLSFTKDMPKDEAIRNALEAFDLPDDYVKFEMEVTFHDNTEVSIEDRK